MNTRTTPVNPHCAPLWPYNAAEVGPLGYGVAVATEACYGASTIAKLLQADAEIRFAAEWADNPDTEPAQFTNNVTAGLFAALNACLNLVHAELEDTPHRVGLRDAMQARAAAAGKAAQQTAADPCEVMLEGEPAKPTKARRPRS